MAKVTFDNPKVKYQDNGGTVHEISSQARSATFDNGVETQDPTAFGDDTRLVLAGLKTGSISLTLFQDFESAAMIDTVLFDELGKQGNVEIIPDKAKAVGNNNPSYSAPVYLTSYPPFGQNVGDIITVDAEFGLAGSVTRSTTEQL